MSAKTVDEYISQFPVEQQKILKKVRKTMQQALPEATERISYGMPGFWQGEGLIWFGAAKDHLGIYPTNSGITEFGRKLKPYKTSKGA